MTHMGRKPEIRISADEWDRIVQSAAPPTPDDCSITADGRRLDTPEKLIAFLDEIAQERHVDDGHDIAL